jgi:hypothetical protein
MRPVSRTGPGGSKNRDNSQCAFTRTELLALLTALFFFAVVLVPSFANTDSRSEQIRCLSNLRQIGIAFQAWGTEHNDYRPWFVPVNQGGTSGHRLQNNAFIHYTPLSNYLSPGLLVDPAEPAGAKRVAENWSMGQGGFLNPAFCDNALSYMFSAHTTVAETQNILVGDRHLAFDGSSGCSYVGAQVQNLAGRERFRGWTNGAHGVAGNLLINDGHVEFASQGRLRQLVTYPLDDTSFFDHIVTPP